MLYELLVGRPPLVGNSVVDTLNKVVHEEPLAPRSVNPDCPRELESICMKCLRKSPSSRYGTARELADDLARYLSDQPVKASSITPLLRIWYWVRDIPLVAAVIGRIMTQDAPPPSEFRADVPPELDAICAKLMARSIEDGYSSMREAVSVWMSSPCSNAAISPGSSARCAMHRSSIWL